MKYDLAVLIPARNEEFLALTVKGLLENKRGNTEIIVGLDGKWAEPGIPDHPDVTILYVPQSIGQRALTNQLCRLTKAKYVMKLDAHCAVDEGFDVKLMADMQDDWTVIPAMYNLHMFDWVCTKNSVHRIYQGPTPQKCNECDGKMFKEIIFKPRLNRRSEFYRFDKTLHFMYWGEFKNRPEGKPDIAPSLSAQGSCFMLTRDKYWELDICDEKHGSWGQQGTEVACKTWLSGGKLMVNKKTWYAHLFRTQGGDFGFPYPISGTDVEKARKYSRWLWKEGNWGKAKYTLDWLINKFAPVPDWEDSLQPVKKPKKGVVYYTDNELDPAIMQACQVQILKGMKEKHIVSVSLQSMDFGKNIVINAQRGYLTMARQILAGLEASDAEVIFFCEHDVLYDPSHFDFIPPEKDKIYYNVNVQRVRLSDGHALYTDNLQQLSGLVAYRDTLIKHYRKRVALLGEKYEHLLETVTEEEFNQYVRRMGFEPGTHNRPERVDDLKAESYKSRQPNIDIRHDKNLTPSRWRKDQFKNQKYIKGWVESHVKDLPGWNNHPLLTSNTFIA